MKVFSSKYSKSIDSFFEAFASVTGANVAGFEMDAPGIIATLPAGKAGAPGIEAKDSVIGATALIIEAKDLFINTIDSSVRAIASVVRANTPLIKSIASDNL